MADKTSPQPAEQSPVQVIAARLAELVGADTSATLAVLAGLLRKVRENDPAVMLEAKPGADALRIELEKWRKALKGSNGEDPLKALLDAGAAAAPSA